jgi:hypothetical protein
MYGVKRWNQRTKMDHFICSEWIGACTHILRKFVLILFQTKADLFLLLSMFFKK